MTSPTTYPWFLNGVPTMNQLGATMGYGVTPNYQGVDYTALGNQYIQQTRDDADRQYGLQKQQLDQQYQIAKMNAKSASERNAIDKWYNEQQVQLAQQRLAEEQRQFNTNTGYNLLSTLSQLKGPADYFQAANYARGVANNPNSAAFLDALRSNVKMPDFGAQQGVPEAETGNTLLAKLGGTYQAGTGGTTNASGSTLGGGATGSAATGNDARLAQISDIYAQGAHKLGGGALENLSPTELGLLQSGIEANGGDWSTFLDQYKRSRIGQSLGLSRAA